MTFYVVGFSTMVDDEATKPAKAGGLLGGRPLSQSEAVVLCLFIVAVAGFGAFVTKEMLSGAQRQGCVNTCSTVASVDLFERCVRVCTGDER